MKAKKGSNEYGEWTDIFIVHYYWNPLVFSREATLELALLVS